MMKAASRHLRTYWYYYFFGLIALCTLYMDAYMARTILDGDASDPLYRGYIMARNHDLLPREYYPTTELRLFDVSFFFALFFKFFSNWTLVRLCGTALMQALYALSFLYMTKQAAIRKPVRWLSAGLLLMPFSTTYARIIIYHLYYIVYMTYFFLLLGLLLRLQSIKAEERRKAILPLCAMALLWILVGLNGVRHLFILLAPLLLLTLVHVLLLLNRYTFQQGRLVGEGPVLAKAPVRFLGWLLLSCVFYFIGFAVYQHVLIPLLGFQNIDGESIFVLIADAQRIARIFNSFCVSIGMRISTLSVLSVRGVSFVLAGFSFGYLLWASWRGGFRDRTAGERFPQTIVYGLFLVSLLLTVVIFAFDRNDRWFELYYVPVLVAAFPVLALEIDRLKESSVSCARKLLIYLTCFAFLFQGGYTSYHLLHKNTSKLDIWSGITTENVMIVECVQDCVEFMQIHGYTHGMAPYWYANVMVEYSDGTLAVAPYRLIVPGEPLEMMKWGTARSPFQPENLPEKLVVFMEKESIQGFRQSYPESVQVHDGAFFIGMEVDAERLFPR